MADQGLPPPAQGAGNWQGYVGPGAENLSNEARASAMAAAGNGSIAFFQNPDVLDNISEWQKMYNAFTPAAVPMGAANMPLSQIEAQYGPRSAEATQGYYTSNPSGKAQELARQYGQQHYTIAGSGINTPQSTLTRLIENPTNAAQIAYNVAVTTGSLEGVTPELARKAASEGIPAQYFPQLQIPQMAQQLAQQMGQQPGGVAPTPSTSVQQSGPSNGFGSSFFQSIPILSDFYNAGKGATGTALQNPQSFAPTFNAATDFIRQTPVLSTIYEAGRGFTGGNQPTSGPAALQLPAGLQGVNDWLGGLIAPRVSAAEGETTVGQQVIRPIAGLDVGGFPGMAFGPSATKVMEPLTKPAPVLGEAYPGPVRNEKEALGLNQLYRAAEFDVLGRPGYNPNAERGSQQWAQNYVELSSAYHHLAQESGRPQPANPFEYQGDLALSYLKGTSPASKSSTYGENITDASILKLPGGQGIQDVAWANALQGKGGNQPAVYPDYETAIGAIEGAKGQYGPYATLYGGGVYGKGTTPLQTTAPAAITQSTTIPAIAPQRNWLDQLNYDVGGWLGLRANAAEQPAGTASPFVQGPATTTPTVSQSDSIFGSISNALKTTPVLNYFYAAGQNVPQDTTQNISNYFKYGGNTQGDWIGSILGSIYRGGGAFELKSDYESIATKVGKEITPLSEKYAQDVGLYNTNLSDYNKALDIYNQNPTQSGYDQLSALKANLDVQKSALDSQRSAIDIKYLPVTNAEQIYQKAAAGLTGNVDQKSLFTYGAGKFIGGLSEGYQTSIESPTRNTLSGIWGLGGFVTGIVSVPRQGLDIAQSGLVGGETIIRNSGRDFPGLASAGLAMQGKGTYELATNNPAELAGSIAGMFLLGYGVSKGATKTIGIARTAGKEYIPIENIGYGPEGRYPLNPVQSADLLSRSFSEGKLYPAPKQMAEGGAVPYLHGENGVPLARLPNAQPGDVTLWTALESSKRTRLIDIGTAYRLETSGGSEVQGMYGAPIAESYFAKVGGGLPQMIGFDLPIKTPIIYSTVVEGVEAVPSTIRNTARAGDYTQVNSYIQSRSATVPSGQGYMPLLKAEYEAIIPDNSIIEITGKQYYTKLGGIGESHFLGTRVPIVEQRSIGFIPKEITPTTIPTKTVGQSYKPSAPISAFNLYSSVAIPAAATYGVGAASGYDGTRKMLSTISGAYPRPSISGSSTPFGGYSAPPRQSYKIPYTRSPTEYTGESALYPRPPYFPYSAPKQSYSPPSSKIISTISAPSYTYPGLSTTIIPSRTYVPPYSPPPYSPPPYRPYYPEPPTYKPPTTPTPPVPIIPDLPGLPVLPGGGAPSPFHRKRRAAFQETFMLGLDLSVTGRKMYRAKSFTTPKKYKRRKKK